MPTAFLATFFPTFTLVCGASASGPSASASMSNLSIAGNTFVYLMPDAPGGWYDSNEIFGFNGNLTLFGGAGCTGITTALPTGLSLVVNGLGSFLNVQVNADATNSAANILFENVGAVPWLGNSTVSASSTTTVGLSNISTGGSITLVPVCTDIAITSSTVDQGDTPSGFFGNPPNFTNLGGVATINFSTTPGGADWYSGLGHWNDSLAQPFTGDDSTGTPGSGFELFAPVSPWLSTTSATSGAGDSSVSFLVAPNLSGVDRFGMIIIMSTVFYIWQTA